MALCYAAFMIPDADINKIIKDRYMGIKPSAANVLISIENEIGPVITGSELQKCPRKNQEMVSM